MNDSDCAYYTTIYLDLSASNQVSAYCINGSYINFPSAWTNFIYTDYSISEDGFTNLIESEVVYIMYDLDGGVFTQYANSTVSFESNDNSWAYW